MFQREKEAKLSTKESQKHVVLLHLWEQNRGGEKKKKN